MSKTTDNSWTVENEGFNFILQDDNKVQDGRIIKQVLDTLIDEGKASIRNNTITVEHGQVAKLSVEELSSLGLPGLYPFALRVSANGNLGDTDLKYSYTFLKDGYTPFMGINKVGAFLEITPDQSYLLNDEQYQIVSSIDSFNSLPRNSSAQSQIINNLITFADIKGLSRKTGVLLDSYLNSEEVIKPSKISLKLISTPDGSIEIEPELLVEIDDGDSEILRPVEDINFTYGFDRYSNVRRLYPLPGGRRVVLQEDQVEALEQIKKHRSVFGEKKELLLKAPQEIFTSKAFNFEQFASRVLEIGEYKPRVFPFLRPNKESWLPPEGGLLIDGELVEIPSNDIRPLYDAVSKAINDGKSEISWKEKRIPTNNATLNSLGELINTGMAEGKPTTAQVIQTINAQKGTKNVLIIHDNLGSLDYMIEASPRPGELSEPPYLRPGIELLEHQKQGLAWLQGIWKAGFKGAILADDMGLGKTLQALSFLAWISSLMEQGFIDKKPILVVAPVVLLDNWQEEYKRFFYPDLFGTVVQMHGSELGKYKNRTNADILHIRRETDLVNTELIQQIIKEGRGLLFNPSDLMLAGLVLTTYETLRDYQLSFGLVEWSAIVLDEAQKIKTPTAMVTTATKAMKYEFGLCLTGTPVENTWVDLWSIMDFAQPGKLGSLKEFNKQYQAPLRNLNTNRESLGLELKDKSNPLIMRRMKYEKLKGLPEKHIQTYKETMSDIQLKTYQDIVRRARDKMPDRLDGGRKHHILQTIGLLRDISLHPFLVSHSEQAFMTMPSGEIIKASARLSKTFQILHGIKEQNEKVLIFLISRKMQRILQNLIEYEFGIQCVRPINGEVAGGRRKDLIDQFQNKQGFQVLILSPEAAGVGLNIVSANHVIHLSRAWNPAKEDQATDRVYRIGQEKPVTVHLPLAIHPSLGENGAFDEKLHRLLEQKRQLSSSVLLPPEIESSELQNLGENLLSAELDSDYVRTVVTLDDIDKLAPLAFEKAIGRLYEKVGYQIELTPMSNDFGADVIGLPKSNGQKGILIQCKHTGNPDKLMGHAGVQEVCTALGVYRKSYGIDFEPLVITNAMDYSSNASQVAAANGVQLYNRIKLRELMLRSEITIGEIL